MRQFHFDAALLPSGFAKDVVIDVDGGAIVAVTPNAAPDGGAERVGGVALPGMINAHSHAFQRMFVGLAERRGSTADSFWTWREAMYRAAAELTPETVHAVAAQLYAEMLASGYTSVVEFHYVHHRPDGSPYAPASAMADAIVAAAREAGIGLTLLPVLYQTSGFGGRPPNEGQRRFLNSAETLFDLIAGVRASAPDVQVGLALHSLRAVPPAALAEALALADAMIAGAPIHIHIAEQTGEVDDCVAWSGRRPVDWLLDEVKVDARWCLVHATHVTPGETERLAGSGAVVALCPSTEGNLGDGFFPLPHYLESRGRLAIGSDSHVTVDPFEELRWLEYGQRLLARRRSIAASEAKPNPGALLFGAALAGGAQAAGRPVGSIAVGRRADILVVDPDHPALAVAPGDALLDTLIFHSRAREALVRVMASGAWVAERGEHRDGERIGTAYGRAAQTLRDTLAESR